MQEKEAEFSPKALKNAALRQIPTPKSMFVAQKTSSRNKRNEKTGIYFIPANIRANFAMSKDKKQKSKEKK